MGSQNTSRISSKPDNQKWKYACLLMVCSLVIIFLFISVRESQSKLKIGFGQHSIDIDINNNQIPLADIISKLFSTDESKIQTRALLMKKHNLYNVEDPNLIHLIETADKDTFLLTKLRALLITIVE